MLKKLFMVFIVHNNRWKSVAQAILVNNLVIIENSWPKYRIWLIDLLIEN